MAMTALALHVLNVALLAGLIYIYAQNYRQLKTGITAGLILFTSLLMIQSLMGAYFDISMVMYNSPAAESASMILEAVKAAAFAILLWVSWK